MDKEEIRHMLYIMYHDKKITVEEHEKIDDFISAQDNLIFDLKQQNNKKDRLIITLQGRLC